MKEYSRALDLMPDWPQAHLCLAMALLKKGEYQDAIAELNKCPHIRRLDHQKEYYLGCALQQTGQIEAAEAHYAEALRLRPGWTEPMNNLAWLMATHPSEQKDRAERAIALAEQACDRTAYRDPNFLDTLAAAYAAAGRFAPAVSTARKALALMTAQGSPEIEEQIRARLALYQAGQPYRESSMPTSVPSAPSRPSP
jgi:spermidine synthase